MRKIGINIGSNLGDRTENIRFAVREIERRLKCRLRTSSVYESESWGYHSDNPFYNIGAEFESDADYEELLSVFKSIEHDCGCISHRNADGSYADRILDIDIIYIGEEIIDTATLKVPHPRMHEREFVLRPLAELSPDWMHPIFHLNAVQLLHNLNQNSNHK